MLIHPLFSAHTLRPYVKSADTPPPPAHLIRTTQQQPIGPIEEKFAQWGETINKPVPLRQTYKVFGTLIFWAKHSDTSKPDLIELKIKRQGNIPEALYGFKVHLRQQKTNIPGIARIILGGVQQLYIVRQSDTQSPHKILLSFLTPQPHETKIQAKTKSKKSASLTVSADGIWNLGERHFVQRSRDQKSDVTFYGPPKGNPDIVVFHQNAEQSALENLRTLEKMMETEPRLFTVPVLFPLEYGQVAIMRTNDKYRFNALRHALEPPEEPRAYFSGGSGSQQ